MARDGLQRGEDRFWVEEAPDSVVLAADEYCCLVDPLNFCRVSVLWTSSSTFAPCLAVWFSNKVTDFS
ncbi:hypothetical protein Golax_025338 [Gossypium laxum]|uniref:Uncharacterized protein n=1 Tax=Gossypium laxum TaxID=34288 RepID=A0A7J9B2E1_9ROSI|nr:hypothetical protein [Gossypium laxum]MBA0729784.1 hypothetical protein [Gossypium laxum]